MPEIPLRLSKISVGFRSKEAFRKICAVRCIDQQSFITYRSVIDLSVTIATPEDIDALHDLFCRCKSLVTAYINVPNVNIPFTRIGLFNLLLPSIQTLKHLLIGYIYDLRNRTNDPLKSLASQLEEMKDRNSIKNITIIVTIPPDWNSQLVPSDHSGWSDLDAVLAHSGWPKLESVSLQIDIWTCKGRSTELQSAFKQLPTTQFPNLSSKKTVLFNFSLNSKEVY
ncbi:hypothetical protein BDN70DRAFT_994344 [Pholiota conissans]|uniref:Uncharacterized protein n=1 Tax=Pholiota conissans TaxID=109636 RepID=A0A9P5YYS2_9AGAR|nr:hypothetical protein BDN70DRAFT_994344 [Pholiota conissans]